VNADLDNIDTYQEILQKARTYLYAWHVDLQLVKELDDYVTAYIFRA